MKNKLQKYIFTFGSIVALLMGVMIYYTYDMKNASDTLIKIEKKTVNTYEKNDFTGHEKVAYLIDRIDFDYQIISIVLIFMVFVFLIGLYIIKSRKLVYTYDRLNDNINEKTYERDSHKEESKSLMQRNRQLLKAQKVASIGFWELDLISNKLVWSEMIYEIFELDPKVFEPSYENFLNTIHPEDRDKVNTAYSNSLENKEKYSIKHRLLMADGRVKWVVEECDTEFDEDGHPLISLGVVQDITVDIEYQQRLFEKSEQFSIITKMASAAIYMTDEKGQCTYVNDLWLRFSGMKIEDALCEGWKKAIHEDDRAEVFENWDKLIASEGRFGLEYRFRSKEGVITWIYGTANAIKDKDGNITGFIGVNTDINELKEKEKQLFQQSSLAQIGELLGNIAHQWRQPLSAITGTTSLLEINMLTSDNFDKELLAESIERINEYTQYLSGTINDFRNFFIENKSDKILKVDLKDSLEKVERLVMDAMQHNYISIVHDIKSCEVEIDESILIQALLNIYGNAIDVMSSEKEEGSNKYLFVSLKETDDSVVISFRDSGGGISDDIISRVFEPYFTTKHKSSGTGIGLYMTHLIITKHLKGKIDLCNAFYEYEGINLTGAEFTIILPKNSLHI